MFLRNNKGNENNWITLDLEGSRSNRDAIGARVKVFSGDDVQVAQKKSTTGYLSQNDSRLHFGLGDREKVEKVEILWPSGHLQVLEDLEANQILKIEEQ